jgi:hypothetical protein
VIHINLKCYHCGKNLMDKNFEIDDHPSVRVLLEHKGKRGALRLSSRYGSHKIDSEMAVPEGDIAEFFCPHCESDLESSRACYECNAPMITFESELGGYLRICSRKGCKRHIIEFEDLETELRAFYGKYSTFFQGRF